MDVPTARSLRCENLFGRHHREVYAYCRRRTDASNAADCASETFLVAWRRIDEVPEGDAALWWLYSVARRVMANQFRSSRRLGRLLDRLRAAPLGRTSTPEAIVVRREQDRDVLAALECLRPIDRELLLLALWEEVPRAEIGAMLGCSTQAVAQRIYRATRRVAKEYQRNTMKARLARKVGAPIEVTSDD